MADDDFNETEHKTSAVVGCAPRGPCAVQSVCSTYARKLISFYLPTCAVFGRRHRRSRHALWRPASKKRQGTKSRAAGHWLAASAMGI